MPLATKHAIALVAKAALIGGVIAGSVFAFRHISLSPQPEQPGTQREPAQVRYVFVGFTSTADTLYLASTDGATSPRKIGEVPHAREWGIRAGVSPDGRWVAYTVMPGGARRSETDAEAWVISIESGGAKRIATGVDLLARPVWSGDSSGFVIRRYDALVDGPAALRLEVATLDGRTTVLARREQTLGLYPIGFADAGRRLLFAEITPEGTDVRSVAGGRDRLEIHVSDGIAREWTISEDGGRLAYLAPVAGGDAVTYRAYTVDLTSAARRTVAVGGDAGDQLGPVWRTGSAELTLGGPGIGTVPRFIAAGGAPGAAVGPAAGSGFEQPLAWSPDGRFLALRAFTGSDSEHPGASSDQILAPAGRRVALPDGPNAFVGWVND